MPGADRCRKLSGALGQSGESGNEDARYLLPYACESKIFVTMKARELLHFFDEPLVRRYIAASNDCAAVSGNSADRSATPRPSWRSESACTAPKPAR